MKIFSDLAGNLLGTLVNRSVEFSARLYLADLRLFSSCKINEKYANIVRGKERMETLCNANSSREVKNYR